MFVIKSCQKIEYNALFMMIFIPVSNFGDQPLCKEKIELMYVQVKDMYIHTYVLKKLKAFGS